MKELIRKHHISFNNAFAGLKWAFLTQPNFRVHLLIGMLAMILGYFVNLSKSEWIFLMFTIVCVLAAEMINTSLEAMTDLITQEWHQDAKIAKDVAAGMMLIVAMGSICIGGFLFIPKLLTLF
jgi:diacylglycerol kinase